MEKLVNKLDKQIRATLKVETRYDWARIDGKKTLAEKMTQQTIELMKGFHIWVDTHYIQGTHFDVNGFYVPKQGKFENYTLDELINKYLEENLEK
jgi:hypothetical protein